MITERVQCAERARHGARSRTCAPGVIRVTDNSCAIAIDQLYNVTLTIAQIVIIGAVVINSDDIALLVIAEEQFVRIKGFYLQRNRIKTITYNDDLPAVLQRIIVAHEFGHSQLHVKSGVHAFHDVGRFNESNRYEKEANLFAAEFLLDDQQVLDSLNSDTTFFAAASTLQVPMELLDFKFRVMKWKGYKLVEPPITARNNFLRDVEVPYGADDSDC